MDPSLILLFLKLTLVINTIVRAAVDQTLDPGATGEALVCTASGSVQFISNPFEI